jgi:uncharacterized protein YjbI with pentapeptide repeats
VPAELARGDRQLLALARYGRTLRGVSFAGQDLTSIGTPGLVWFDRCCFDGADLRQATAHGWHLKFCSLRTVDLRGASLRGASFAGCDLTDADLRGADLSGARFSAVNTGDDSGRTVLTGARLDPDALVGATLDPGTVLP